MIKALVFMRMGLSRYLIGLPGMDLVGFFIFLFFANLSVALWGLSGLLRKLLERYA